MKTMKQIGCLLVVAMAFFTGCVRHIEKPAPEIFVFDMHNESFSVWNNWHQKNPKENSNAILIHIDTHPDMATDKIVLNKSSNTKENNYWEGSFIHPAVWYGIVKDIWCIQPDEFASNGSEEYYAVEYNVGDGEIYYLFNNLKPVLTKGVVVKSALVNYRVIEDLPNLSNTNRPIFIDIDMDYFACMPAENTNILHNIQQLVDKGVSEDEIKLKIKSKIDVVLGKLAESGIEPTIITMARSPNYAINKYIPFIEQELVDGVKKRFNAVLNDEKK